MKIKTRLIVNIIVLVIFAAIAILVINNTNHHVSDFEEKAAHLNEITEELTQSSVLLIEYLNDFEKQKLDSLLELQELITKNLRQKDCIDNESREFVNRISENHQKRILLTQKLRNKISEEKIPDYVSLSNIADYRDLLMQTNMMLTDAHKLTWKVNQDLIILNHDHQHFIFYSLITLMGLYILVIIYSGRSVLTDILKLHEGTSAISAGKFNHFIDIDRKDEIGELAYAFNLMTQSIQVSHSSLRVEMNERLKAEQEVKLLYTISEEINKTDSIELALNRALGIVCENAGWAYGEAWVPDSSVNRLKMITTWTKDEKLFKKFINASRQISFNQGEGHAGRVWVSQSPEWIEDVSKTKPDYFVRAKLLYNTGLKAALAVPIIVDKELLAVISFFMTKSKNEDPKLVNLVSGIASQIGAVLKRKLTEIKLKESEASYRKFFDDDLTGDFALNTKGEIIDCNFAFLKMFGLESKTEARHINVTSLLADATILDRLLTAVTDNQKITEYEIELLKKDGTPISVLGTASGLYNESGELIQVRGYLLDITDRKKLEQQLLQSQKMEALGRLAGGVAHDFNNLLSVIGGYSEILKWKMTESDPDREKLDLIYKASERAASLTQQLLAFSRKQIIQPKILNVNSSIEVTGKMLRRLIGEDIELITGFDPNVEHIRMDPGQFEQIIMNLSINARDAMPGGGKLIIGTKNFEINEEFCCTQGDVTLGHYVSISVTDTGIGMDKETLSHIYEPFYTTKEPGKGTGLGLATVYGIIKQNKGHIIVYSEPDHGTTFHIYLPVAESKNTKIRTVLKNGHKFRGNETILMVEDEESVRNLLLELLEGHGYKVLPARNGEEAISINNEYDKEIHLLLTDLVMPGINGRKLAKRLMKKRPDMRVIYMSGYTDHSILDAGVLAEQDVFIQKPISLTFLLEKIHEVLKS